MSSILARTAQGAGWVIAWRLMTRLLGVASTLVLVRLLSPADFGLVALATAFALALDVCLSIGVEDQIVRSPAPTRALYDTAFTLNLMKALTVAVLLAVCAAPAAGFFGDARLRDVLLALALSAALSGATNIGIADFRRHLSFEKEFRLQFLPRLAGISMTIGIAWAFRSHWALVLGVLTNRAGIVLMSHVLHPYRQRLSLAAWRELSAVSFWSWAISVAATIRDRADSFVIGRVLGPAPLGIYAVGVEVAALPTTEMVDPICRACMPGFAATLRDAGQEGVAPTYLRIIGLMAVLTLPAGIGTSLIAEPVVAVVFGPAWQEAATVMALIALGCTMSLAGNVSAALLNARAALRSILIVTALAAMLRIGLLLLFLPFWGLFGAALAIALALVLEHLALVGGALRLLALRPWELLRVVHRPALAAAAMAALLWGCGLGWAPSPSSPAAALTMLGQAIPLAMASYALVLLALWRLAGGPAGAEADLLRLFQTVLARLRLPRRRLASR
ncbi:MAG: oligosaccharide flippase family protein [Roseococcus sp.]|nr:oligosaccharide flippase family protein [Roseococcus sp.]